MLTLKSLLLNFNYIFFFSLTLLHKLLWPTGHSKHMFETLLTKKKKSSMPDVDDSALNKT